MKIKTKKAIIKKYAVLQGMGGAIIKASCPARRATLYIN
tara:strand:- start:1218 stop:1334 length:117 start_codon:yes stop_codon:yes gene_type:complete